MKPILYISLIPLFIIGILACGASSSENEVDANHQNTTQPTKVVVNNDTDDTEEADVSYSNEVQGVEPNKSGRNSNKVQRIGFYNVENLFDTKDDANKLDEEFLPSARNEWTDERYGQKLEHLAKVIDYMGQPGIMGLCEVENQSTLKSLIKEPTLKSAKYNYVHKESPDIRGIDVALLYSKDEYELVKKEFVEINFPSSIVKDYTTRDILYATLQNKKKEYIHVFVCHWPSRRGGVQESEPKRLYVAKQVRKKVDEVFKNYENNHVIVLGDLNDEPANKSVSQILNAKPEVSDPKSEQLYDLMYELERKGYGSHNYRGDWNMLDHIIVSGSLLDKKDTDVKNPKVFNRDWMLFYHRKTGQYRPNRTYSGGKYYGGYSDHLPVCVELN